MDGSESTIIAVKRIYEPVADSDGQRILVDRIWPRGVSKADAHLDEWMPEVAPSNELRTWFGHDPDRWDEFRLRYRRELDGNPAVQPLLDRIADGPVTLLYSARDESRNQAVVLQEHLTDSR